MQDRNHDLLWILQSDSLFKNNNVYSAEAFLDLMEAQIDLTIRRLPLNIKETLKKLKEKPVYECKYCGKKFQQACSLGGHMSKMHGDKRVQIAEQQRVNSESEAALSQSQSLQEAKIEDGIDKFFFDPRPEDVVQAEQAVRNGLGKKKRKQ